MKLTFVLLTLLCGIVMTVHLSMNGQVGALVKNPRMANAMFWCIGAVVAVIIGISGWDSAFFSNIKSVPAWLFFAAVMGACLVFGIAWIVPKVGAGPFFILLIAGQIITGVVVSHFGWLGSPVEKIDWLKIVGIVIMVTGVVLANYSDKILAK